MSQIKLLLLVANLVFVRLALTVANEIPTEIPTSTNSNQQQQDSSILDQINSLDFAPQEQIVSSQASELHHDEKVTLSQERQNDSYSSYPLANNENVTQSHKPRRTGKSTGQAGRKRHAASPTFAQLMVNLLGQLEKIDVKRLITDSLVQVKPRSGVASSNLPEHPFAHRSSNNFTSDDQSSRAKERINGSALSAETGNILSITKQLVKLARGQMMGGIGLGGNSADFGSPNSWISPMMPGMLSAASHMFQHDSNDFAAASKSDLFWMVVPAVIVIGAGVIVLPLIAAWLVSHMMNQNTFTVSAGRKRRRRRDVSDQDPLSSNFISPDLFKMLDMHKLLDEAPQLLVNKLSRLHAALNSVGSSLEESTK